MSYIRDYMRVPKRDFSQRRPGIEWRVFPSLAEQNEHFASHMVARIRAAGDRNQRFVVVLPTGPIDFEPFVRMVNEQRVSLANLNVFMMDEYCKDPETLIDEDHPLSFRKYVRGLLIESVDPGLRMEPDALLFPNPADPGMYRQRIDELGGIHVVFGGFGVNGHLAFNDPPDEDRDCTVENVRNSTTRVLRLSRETITQNAIGGTRGLLELVPPLAVTIGMQEMMAAHEIHIYLLRKWHSGVFRRCLFGPVTPKVPGSFLQEHPKVRVHMPEYVAQTPEVIVTLDI